MADAGERAPGLQCTRWRWTGGAEGVHCAAAGGDPGALAAWRGPAGDRGSVADQSEHGARVRALGAGGWPTAGREHGRARAGGVRARALCRGARARGALAVAAGAGGQARGDRAGPCDQPGGDGLGAAAPRRQGQGEPIDISAVRAPGAASAGRVQGRGRARARGSAGGMGRGGLRPAGALAGPAQRAPSHTLGVHHGCGIQPAHVRAARAENGQAGLAGVPPAGVELSGRRRGAAGARQPQKRRAQAGHLRPPAQSGLCRDGPALRGDPGPGEDLASKGLSRGTGYPEDDRPGQRAAGFASPSSG